MKIFIFLFFFSFSLSLDFSAYSANITTCEELLIDHSKILTDEQHKELCDILTTYPLFMIRLRNEIEYAIHGAVFFEAVSFKYFDNQCQKFQDMCQYGFLIDIYIDDKVIIIQPGAKAKSLVNDVYRKRTIASVRTELIKGTWHKALRRSSKGAQQIALRRV